MQYCYAVYSGNSFSPRVVCTAWPGNLKYLNVTWILGCIFSVVYLGLAAGCLSNLRNFEAVTGLAGMSMCCGYAAPGFSSQQIVVHTNGAMPMGAQQGYAVQQGYPVVQQGGYPVVQQGYPVQQQQQPAYYAPTVANVVVVRH